MIPLFLPVSLYKVKFKVAAGRPFSRFEQLLLRAIGTGVKRLDELVETFCVHRRMVVESLVTLMQAGWVSIDSASNEFGLTPNGEEACKTENVSPSLLYTDERWQIIVMERVAGQVARGDKVRLETKRSLSKVWQPGAVIPKSDISNSVDPGMVRPLLSGRSGERVRWIGPITAASDSNAFVIVGVDTASERVIGIPAVWQALLGDDLLDRARKREKQLIVAGTTSYEEIDFREMAETDLSHAESTEHAYAVSFDTDDITIGYAENAALLNNFLASSTSFVAIASSTLRGSAVREAYSAFEGALARGISISICWGNTPSGDEGLSEHKDAVKLLEKLQWDSRRAVSGRLVVGASQGRFHANVLVGDVGGYVQAAAGAHSWLGAQGDVRGVSVRLRHAGVVARLCDLIGDYQASDHRLKRGAALTRLRNAALDLSTMAAEGGESLTANGTISLLFDGHNQAEFKKLMSTAREIIVVGADSSPDAVFPEQIATVDALCEAGRAISIYLRRKGTLNGSEVLGDARELRWQRVAEVPVNFIAVDNTRVVISSHRFFESDASDRAFGSQIGVSLSSSASLAWLAERLSPPKGT